MGPSLYYALGWELMISDKKLQAARANGALSRGPKTPEGKARSSRNATRHGLLAKCVVLRNESREGFHALFNQYVERFDPVDDVELAIVEELVAAAWRLRRAWAIETRLFDADMEARPAGAELDRLAGAFGDLASGPKLALLHRYETRLHMMAQRAIQNLGALRHPVLRNEPNNSFDTSAIPQIAGPNEPAPGSNEPTGTGIEPTDAVP